MPTEENLAEGDRRGGDNSEEAYVTFVRTFPLLKFGSGPSMRAVTCFHVPQKNSSFIYVTNNGFYKVHAGQRYKYLVSEYMCCEVMKITICRGDAPEASTYLADSSQPSKGVVYVGKIEISIYHHT